MNQPNSTQTRVTPIFDQLRQQDPTGNLWLTPLLSLFENKSNIPIKLTNPINIQAFAYGSNEKSLPAPIKLLRWLIENVESERLQYVMQRQKKLDPDTKIKREKLAQQNPEVIQEALSALTEYNGAQKKWYILEGASRPDVFIQTDELILVLEGKHTEKAPTMDTEYMSFRPQILRHLDAAWEIKDHRQVLAGFIVEAKSAEAEDPEETWEKSIQTICQPENLAKALPHRSKTEREEIAKSFLGVVTWQKICRNLHLNSL